MSSKNARLCANNWVTTGVYSTSTEQASYPASNLEKGLRASVFKPRGTFEITTLNQKVYINGSTFTVPVGSYSHTALITAFNTATSQTLTRNDLGRFIITLGSSGTVNFSNDTNAIWETLGFLRVSDETATIFTADERRYNNGEWIKVDNGFPQVCDFAALLGPTNEAFSCPTAEIRLQGNNVDYWESPAADYAMEVSSVGAFYAPALDTMPTCRYWRILVKDYKNSNIALSVAYMGTATIPLNTNFSIGFSRNRIDQSLRLYSEGGQLYVDRRPKLLTITSAQILFLKDQDLEDIEQLVFDLGTGTPFFIVIDPQIQVSRSLEKMTHYVELDGDVTFTHVLNSYYNLSFQMREVL